MPASPAPETDRLGRYELVEELGRGATSVVYLAHDPLIGRDVAIKAFHRDSRQPGDKGSGGLTSILHEARSAGVLSHPNIVSIHDVVDGESGRPGFIAMEWVRGSDLRDLIVDGQDLPLELALKIAAQVANALEYAHSNGVVHRDIKPANILITPEENIKITDFGIASPAGTKLNGDELFGTPGYMAPELIVGRTVDHRADLFSLGVLLYEMVTGSVPFQSDTIRDLVQQIATQPHSPASKLRPRMPVALDRLINKALAKRPEFRFQTAAEMNVAIQHALANLKHPGISTVTQDLSDVLPRSPHFRIWTDTNGPKRSPISPWRLITTSALALVLGLTASWMVLTRLNQAGSGDPAISPEHQLRLQYTPLLKEAQRKLRAGDAEGAVEVLALAEEIAPDQPQIRRLLLKSQREAADIEAYSSRETQVRNQLAAGHRALARGDAQGARRIAMEILARSPERLEALSLAARASALTAKQRRDAQLSAASAQKTVVDLAPSQPVETAPEKPALPPPPPFSNLTIDLFSQQPRGSLTIYSGQDRIVHERFESQATGPFWKRKKEPAKMHRTYELPAGEKTLRAYVNVDGQPAQLFLLSSPMVAGSRPRLQVTISEVGKALVSLDGGDEAAPR